MRLYCIVPDCVILYIMSYYFGRYLTRWWNVFQSYEGIIYFSKGLDFIVQENLWYNIIHYGLPTSDIKVYDMHWYNIWNYQYDAIPECILLSDVILYDSMLNHNMSYCTVGHGMILYDLVCYNIIRKHMACCFIWLHSNLWHYVIC